jgi:hypothetical protein
MKKISELIIEEGKEHVTWIKKKKWSWFKALRYKGPRPDMKNNF